MKNTHNTTGKFAYKKLIAGNVAEDYFEMLCLLAGVNSEKMLSSLRYFLVEGKTRKESCELSGVSQGNFSVKLRYVNDIYAIIHNMNNISPHRKETISHDMS